MILIVEQGSENLKGHLRRSLYEPSSGIFYGKVSASVRNLLWDMVKEDGAMATLIYDYPCEQGYKVEKNGETTRHVVDFDGLNLYEREKQHLVLSDCIAKSNGTTVLDHLYETGNIARLLMKYGRAFGCMDAISNELECDKESSISFITYLSAIHDIGKLHPLWQLSKIDENSNIYNKYKALGLLEKDNIAYENTPFRHEKYGALLFKKRLKEKYGVRSVSARRISELIAYHHQGKNQESRTLEGYEIKNKDIWSDLQEEAFSAIEKAFPCEMPKHFLSSDENNVEKLRYTIIAIIITADWVSSSDDVSFPKRSYFKSDKDYFENTEHIILSWMKKNDLYHNELSKEELDYKNLFGFSSPTATQRKTEEITKKYGKDINVMLIEDVCGSGKTEAAYMAAAYLLRSHNKSGIYVGLPTGATTMAMYNRTDTFLSSLELLPIGGLSEFTSKSFLYRKKEKSVQTWCDPSRLKFLKSSAIGTVDQSMQAVMACRYGAIRWLGITDKVLIIDELHAYDFYMMEIIEKLIEWCNWANVPVILLSATLPQIQKKKLFYSVMKNFTPESFNNDYPLISTCIRQSNGNIYLKEDHTECKKIRETPYEILKWNKDKIQTIIDKALGIVNNDGNLCIILNTVDEAIETKNRLKDVFDGDLYLLHARNFEIPKHDLTEKIVYLFGKKGKENGDRPKKAIVIATQIMEQSIDVDFDYMISDIAPIDALIQRIGRWHRHSDDGTVRYNNNFVVPVQILCPENSDFGTSQIIYDKNGELNIFSNTVTVLNDKNIINEPYDIRYMIDTVYVESEKYFSNRYQKNMEASIYLIKGVEADNYKDFYRSFCVTRQSDIDYKQVCLIDDKDFDEIEKNMNDQDKRYETSLDLLKYHVVSLQESKVKGSNNSLDIKEHGLLDKDAIFLKVHDGKAVCGKNTIQITNEGIEIS